MKNLVIIGIIMFLTVLFSTCKKDNIKPSINHPSSFIGRWINNYVFVNDVKNSTAERYQFQFSDSGKVVMTSANDTTIDKKYDSWTVLGNYEKIELVNGNIIDLYEIFQKPVNNTMILKINYYKYYLIKVK